MNRENKVSGKGYMNARTVKNFPEKMYWYLGDGALLSLFWWGLAQANDPLASAHRWPSLVIALGGFVLATPILILLNTSKFTKPQNRKSASIGLAPSILFPLALLGLFVWDQFGPSATGWLTVLAHPGMLTINLTASLLIGTILNRFGSHLGKGLAWPIWWLWQLPLIFINGSVLLHYHFSNLLMFFYLATVLILSAWLFWWPMKNQ
jgi:hypothetical protein